jgi:hypothetical protein
VATLQAADGDGDAAALAVNAASAALMTSDLPWAGPAAAVRVGMIDGQLVVSPDMRELRARGTMDLLYAANEVGRGVGSVWRSGACLADAGGRQRQRRLQPRDRARTFTAMLSYTFHSGGVSATHSDETLRTLVSLSCAAACPPPRAAPHAHD